MRSFTIHLPDEAATGILGNDLSRALVRGDCVTLSGDLGAGKTTLCRALIRSLAGDAQLDVPSPTFTLVQAYDMRLPVTHLDLYRLNDPHELDELGLDEALENGVALIEWPQKAEGLLPLDCIEINFTHEGNGRIASITCPDAAFARIERTFALRAFLERCGHSGALRQPFAGDASPRVYETIADTNGNELVIMDQRASPAGPLVWKGKAYRDVAHTTNPTVHPFIAIGTALAEKGFATPHILHRDLQENFLLIEHLGNGSFLDAQGSPLADRYALAGQLLAAIHSAHIEQHINAAGLVWTLPVFDRDALMIEVSLALDWYLPYRLKRSATDAEREEFFAAWDELFKTLEVSAYGIMLRDFHSPNLVWRAEKSGFDRLGVLDFQDALWGPNAYDLASLAQDARVTIDPEIETLTIDAYIKARSKVSGIDALKLRREYALMALQRNTKILGIFIRLNQRDGKPQYLAHLPRIETYVRRTLKASGFSRLQAFYADMGL
jgi:N-acetylmuramate 1-kinase